MRETQNIFPSHSTLGGVSGSSGISSEGPSPIRRPLHGLRFYRADCTVAQALAGELPLLYSGTSLLLCPQL